LASLLMFCEVAIEPPTASAVEPAVGSVTTLAAEAVAAEAFGFLFAVSPMIALETLAGLDFGAVGAAAVE